MHKADLELTDELSLTRGWCHQVQTTQVICKYKDQVVSGLDLKQHTFKLLYRHAFSDSPLEVSDQFHAPAAFYPVPTGCEAEWALEPL